MAQNADWTVKFPDLGVNVNLPRETSGQKQRIERAAAELFARHGYGSVGVAELCDATGMGRGTLYYHIKNKECVLFNIATGYMRRLNEGAAQILEKDLEPETAIRALSRLFMRVMFDDRNEMTVCFRELHSCTPENQVEIHDLHREYQDFWLKVIRKGVDQGRFREISKVKLKGLLGMYFYSFLWVNPFGSNSADQIAEEFSQLVVSSLSRL
ncbi:TetR/AcrR family transcriptional regulator [Methylonatrum kenyense]|uniref:TetR/AcrR family transcriptional regulator n=1 Tax=Methylonatrum kenyense TaxID=455253 RepID=UPI0020C16F0C|nr:TetR/AcrR family transcriptional regulator [Methylonatrum kenyense]MCK8517195.1 TetR/AcrR family transcriptional regulator [Methylonatrum kenyense]